MQPLLWDTCAAIWIYEKARLAQAALDAMNAAHREGVPSYVSPITAWEVGMLAARGRSASGGECSMLTAFLRLRLTSTLLLTLRVRCWE